MPRRKKVRPPKTIERLLIDGIDAAELRKVRDQILADAANVHGLVPPGLVLEARRLLANALIQANIDANDPTKVMALSSVDRAKKHLEVLNKAAAVKRDTATALEALKGEQLAQEVKATHIDLTAVDRPVVRSVWATHETLPLILEAQAKMAAGDAEGAAAVNKKLEAVEAARARRAREERED